MDMSYDKKDIITFIISPIIVMLVALTIILSTTHKPNNNGEMFTKLNPEKATQALGADGTNDRNRWEIFEGFDGYQTKADPQKISVGGNPIGQNTLINDGDRITSRDFGYEIFPNEEARSEESGEILSIHTFRKRDGENIIVRANDDGSTTTLEYYDDDIGVWEELNSGYTSGAEFGFADHNTNVDQTGYVYFGNSYEPYSRWTGRVAALSNSISAGTSTIPVDDTLLFPTSGDIVICGTEYEYTSKDPTSFTLSGTTTAGCAEGRGVAQQVEEFPAAPKGDILKVLNTRMFVAGVRSSTQALYYSQIADATDFTFSSPRVANDGGIINMPEGGGAIVGMAIDEGVLYTFKRNLIKSITFTNDGEDLPVVKPVKPFDGKSQTVGAVNQKSIFTGGNGVFFITPNNEIMNLSRIPDVDYPQVRPISDPIKPTANALDWTNSSGVYWENKAYFAATTKENDFGKNDVILIWNTARQAWESPVVGINISDFVIAKFGVDDELFYAHNSEPNIYQINNTGVDDIYGFAANWRSREETFGAPHLQKTIDMFYVEGYIDDNTELEISLLLDEDGYTQTYSTTIVGSDIRDYQFEFTGYNLFGFHPFGFERFGSNEDFTGSKKFRIYFGRGVDRIPFHSLQIEFASDGKGQNWEILRYGYSIQVQPNPIPSNLLKAL